MRLLLPQRFDVLGRSMDTNIVTQWLGLEAACDLVLWGPGLDGFVPGMPLDEVAEYVDADVVLLHDLHHAIPGLWSELWTGVERVRRPVVWHLVDFQSAIDQRRAVWERIRPAAVLICYAESNLQEDYADLLQRFGTSVLTVPWGYDAALFHPAATDAERDIDVLLSGADDHPGYEVRRRVKRAARALSGEFRVVELGHPGYWESTGLVQGRGQAQFADLLRRSRLATTGTGGCALMRKYWEAAGCGTIGVGDLPLDQPDSERFADAMLCIDSTWDEERIGEEMRRLLSDRDRCAELSERAIRAVSGCDHRERAHDYVAALASVALDGARERRPRPFPAAAQRSRKLCVAAEPAAVPTVRPDWIDAWAYGAPGASRTRRVEQALAGDEQIAVIAFDPDAALDAEALILARACTESGRVVLRPGIDPRGDVIAADWSAVAAPRAALVQALSDQRGRSGVEAALLALGAELGWLVLSPGGVYTDPASALARLALDPRPGPIQRALDQALTQQRLITAAELRGLAAAHGWGQPAPAAERIATAVTPQDPECELLEDAAFACFDPRVAADFTAIAEHARLGPEAAPLHIGVPVSAGIAVADALSLLAGWLTADGVDLDATPELLILERPMFEGELAWLADHAAAPASALSLQPAAA
jgi:hypothetical protein